MAPEGVKRYTTSRNGARQGEDSKKTDALVVLRLLPVLFFV